MYQTVGQNVGNYIGEFLEYDEKINSNFPSSYMCIRFLFDVWKPLKKIKKIKKPRGESKEVSVKCET